MSTQAPSAAGATPSTGAGETAEPATLPSPKAVREGRAADPTKIKPIPAKKPAAKPSLPGVVDGDEGTPFDKKIAKALGRDEDADDGSGMADGDSEFSARLDKPEGEGKSKGESEKPAGKTPQRGADGKFLKTAGEAAGEETGEEAGEETREEGAEEKVEVPEEPAEPVDQEFEADERVQKIRAEHAELLQKHKSLQGMFAPLNLKVQETVKAQHAAAKSAIAWKAHAESLQAQLEQFKNGKGGPAASGAPAPGGRDQAPATRSTGDPGYDAIVKSVDWEQFPLVKAQGDDALAVWLISHALNISRSERAEEIEKLREELRADFRRPAEDAQQAREIAQHALDVFTRVADIKDADGNDAFPELSDEKEAGAVADMWMKMGMDPDILLTPAGVVQAVLSYRFYSGKGAPTTAKPAPADVDDEETGDEETGDDRPAPTHISSRALRGMVGGSRGSAIVRGRAPLGNDEASRVIAGLRATEEVDPVLGFPRRK